MSKRKNGTKKDDFYYDLARGIVCLGFLAYGPIAIWWNSFPQEGHVILLGGATALLVTGLALVWLILEYRRHQRSLAWRRAMCAWNKSAHTGMTSQRQSARILTESELEQFAAQLYATMGYQAKRTGQTSDHGVDVWMVNPKQQVELVQCKQWNKPVGEPQVRDLYGAIMHAKAVRGWLWAPRGFSRPAKAWAKGKPIILMDDDEIGRLVESAYAEK